MVISVPGEYLAMMVGDVMLTEGTFLSGVVVDVVGITTGVLVGIGVVVPSEVRVNAFRQTLVFGYAVVMSVHVAPSLLTQLSPARARAFVEYPL